VGAELTGKRNEMELTVGFHYVTYLPV
jgi:hypothetical protein